jgi:GNAT superfamily N-acetyltransferase
LSNHSAQVAKPQANELTFQVEPLAPVWDDFIRLSKMHWLETEQYQVAELNPDVESYIHYNNIGYHRLYTVRDGDNYIGHAGIYIRKSMHTQVLGASEDVWFVLPEYRGRRIGKNLLKFIEDDLRSLGVEEFTMSAKMSNDAGKLMELFGFDVIAKQYFKRLV